MRTRYSVRALVSEKVEEVFMASPISMYNWDQSFLFDTVEELFILENLSKMCDLLVGNGFLAKFYDKVIEKNRRFAYYYRTVLAMLLYHIQYETFLDDFECKKPSLVFIEGYEDSEGKIIKYPHINEDFNYSLIVYSMEQVDKAKKMNKEQ